MKGKLVQALGHDNDNLCNLWYKRLEHPHYKVLSILREIVIGLTDFSIKQQVMCRCAHGKNAKDAFLSSEYIQEQMHKKLESLNGIGALKCSSPKMDN